MVRYRFGAYCLSPEHRRLDCDGVAIPLTPKAFDLLVALITHRERAVSKDEILALVWPGAHVEEGNLAQQVLLLRRAFAEGPEVIATLPRYGYRFVAPVIEDTVGGGPAASPHCLVWDRREFLLREGVTVIGRADDVDLQLPLPSLSRRHAKIVVRALEAELEDLGSRHGSWRGGRRVDAPVQLVSGDEIRLGSATLVYRLVLPEEPTAP